MKQLNNINYIKHISTVGDKQKIIADNDIYSVTGIKLIGKGCQINTSLYRKLLSHKLTRPLDESLLIEDCITTDKIISKIHELSNDNILAKEILLRLGDKTLISRTIKSIKIPRTLKFKLSILEQTIEKTINHCLLVALTSIYLAHRVNIDTNQMVKLAYAAIFLDIGILHLDHEIFHKTSQLTDDEIKQIHSHPIVAALIVNAYLRDTVISVSIMDHHERADGSGYPKGKVLEEISQNGQILGISELAASLSETHGKYSYKAKIQAILKFNSEQYSNDILTKLLDLISLIDEPTDINHININQSDFIDTLLKLWSVINNYVVEDKDHNDAFTFVSKHLFSLKQNLNMSGLSQNICLMSNEDINDILYESEEIHALLDEAYYKLKSIIREVKRRWHDKIYTNNSFNKISSWLNDVDSIMD
ncbi:MAG: hypothetical protein OEY89_16870 [Gammaproteobacteria bacterium]|nr:hypothetical protein [Gammaproteobacteria bacterium]